MEKRFKIMTGFIIMIALVCAYFWPTLRMEVANSAHYTEQDKREYNFYTPDILKTMPRISARYTFDFANIAGPAKHVYAMKFYDTAVTDELEKYLSERGYKETKCDFDSVCWSNNDPQEAIYIDKLKGENNVIVQVVYTFS